MVAAGPEVARRHRVAGPGDPDRDDRHPVARRQHRCSLAHPGGTGVGAPAGALRVHEQIPAPVQQLVEVARGALVKTAAAPVHRHGPEQQRHHRRDPAIAVEVVGRSRDRGAPADPAGKRGKDHRRVHVAAVVGDQDHRAADPRQLVAAGRAAADIEVHHRGQQPPQERLADPPRGPGTGPRHVELGGRLAQPLGRRLAQLLVGCLDGFAAATLQALGPRLLTPKPEHVRRTPLRCNRYSDWVPGLPAEPRSWA